LTLNAKEQKIIYEVDGMRAYVAAARIADPVNSNARDTSIGLVPTMGARSTSIGLVPTMGALHAGHLSLIRRAAEENDLCVVSVFVNPTQFDNRADYDAYPNTLVSDADMAFKSGADVIFAPSAEGMYPEGFSTFVDMTGITEKLCGASRESHFRGVLTVVTKLFNICVPDRAYFGEKDAQQLAVVRKMVSELCMNLEIVGCPTVREEDGLAMSSRNARLSAIERTAANCLYSALIGAKALFNAGKRSPKQLAASIRITIEKEPLARLDYVELVTPTTFKTPGTASEGDLLMLAVYIGDIRLIDNMGL
jgi:pantoate--beta-alanine ligase